ncbi:PREDICTED: uncharacterized protein LOC109177280 [Ipomoea nil]|uniref:uncharacterized protein LOC109177280 n=1 Tax=Ipomoea nil TaxID=35883 RepID=UPI0009011B24|nr:PREDICTED: uncharacterized protein LOC109177280 [Ipomoea nil]
MNWWPAGVVAEEAEDAAALSSPSSAASCFKMDFSIFRNGLLGKRDSNGNGGATIEIETALPIPEPATIGLSSNLVNLALNLVSEGRVSILSLPPPHKLTLSHPSLSGHVAEFLRAHCLSSRLPYAGRRWLSCWSISLHIDEADIQKLSFLANTADSLPPGTRTPRLCRRNLPVPSGLHSRCHKF